MMPQPNGATNDSPQDLISSDDKIVVSRRYLIEILRLLNLATPLVGAPRPPERHWSAIKTMKLYRARKLLKRAISYEQ